jgi:hypothetical protein
LPTSPAAVTATTIVSLCTSMPINRVGCSMTRLLCLRLHARPSGATLDHAHGRAGHSFTAAMGYRVKGAPADAANTDGSAPRVFPLPGPEQSPGLTSFPGFTEAGNGHEVYRAVLRCRAFHPYLDGESVSVLTSS